MLIQSDIQGGEHGENWRLRVSQQAATFSAQMALADVYHRTVVCCGKILKEGTM